MTASIWPLSIPYHLSRSGLCAYQCRWDHTRLNRVLAGDTSINIAAVLCQRTVSCEPPFPTRVSGSSTISQSRSNVKELFFFLARLPVASVRSVHVRCLMAVGFRWFTALDYDLLKRLSTRQLALFSSKHTTPFEVNSDSRPVA